jgi:hypothetical protein
VQALEARLGRNSTRTRPARPRWSPRRSRPGRLRRRRGRAARAASPGLRLTSARCLRSRSTTPTTTGRPCASTAARPCAPAPIRRPARPCALRWSRCRRCGPRSPTICSITSPAPLPGRDAGQPAARGVHQSLRSPPAGGERGAVEPLSPQPARGGRRCGLSCPCRGVEPTNNAAERALRPAVRWRKGSFGSQCKAGAECVARLLSVAVTPRPQDRSPLAYLAAVCTAAQCGHPSPSLLPEPTARQAA